MRIIQSFPPNHEEISHFIPYKEGNIYCYGDVIYSPSSKEIPEDLIYHESIHQKQQEILTPHFWWQRYCTDKQFRKEQELEAYAYQYLWIKDKLGGKIADEALQEMSLNLSGGMYGLNITANKAQIEIRRIVKQIVV